MDAWVENTKREVARNHQPRKIEMVGVGGWEDWGEEQKRVKFQTIVFHVV